MDLTVLEDLHDIQNDEAVDAVAGREAGFDRLPRARGGEHEQAVVDEALEHRERLDERLLGIAAVGPAEGDDRLDDRRRLGEPAEEVGGPRIDDARRGPRVRARHGVVLVLAVELVAESRRK